MKYKTRITGLVAVTLMCFLASSTLARPAEIQERFVEYNHRDTVCEGFLAYTSTHQGKLPGILVFHEWNGINPQILERCRMLARMGYVAFAADIYGKGVRPADREESAKEATRYRTDRSLMRERANASLKEIRKLDMVDPQRIASIGYCFGGGVALEQARSGADILGAVSFHGNLDTPNPGDARNILASILVLHGAADPYVPMAQVDAFRQEMESARVNWRLVMYGGAVHSFTNPGAGDDPSQGSAYDKQADRLSWESMKRFFEEIFAR